MKTQPSQLKAVRAYRARQAAKQWLHWSVFAPFEIVAALKKKYNQLRADRLADRLIQKIEVSDDGGLTRKTVYEREKV